ncbi:hypothetical protein G4H71_12645 [Rhodococcus triatomae]|uniref:hypothetical protein n=1 Tax=Rhodococcus triatomae TaxID=300028 RepID=UPI001472AEE1|nr:hypothetical protein [Rhodococcus triatomae]QNG20325.1 hypothetical protein G4H72_17735 [Rhodococcus triatomae]QNG23759.1 hypothetical protein G4H71_12645 [Rhodococcus triatomae]
MHAEAPRGVAVHRALHQHHADLHHALVEAVISGDAARAVELSREPLDALLRELGGAAR